MQTDYPSACNAAESLLLHEGLVASGLADRLLRMLRSKGIQLHGGPRALRLGLTERACQDLHTEYSDLAMTVEIVSSVEEAVAHIHAHGSGHTETVVTESASCAAFFLRHVASACVFHNASTRFADGYRFGLGAEVGISTARVGARGPVGVEGLMTSKWVLRSTAPLGHTVRSFSEAMSGEGERCVYTHKALDVKRQTLN